MLAAATGATVAGLAADYCALPCARILQVRALRQRMAQHRMLMMTYDDGPGPQLTPRVLEVLSGWRAKAVFFSLGRRAVDSPEIVQRIVSEGHELGCHSRNHTHPWKTWPWRAPLDCQAGFNVLRRWLPDRPLFRPPYGKMTLATWCVMRRYGARVLWWTEDSEDTYPQLPDPQRLADRIAAAGGGVVLLHDFDRRQDERAAYVLEATERVLRTAAREGIHCVRIGERVSIQSASPVPCGIDEGPLGVNSL